jgi:mannitol-1-/sugar-/sorbitol-6-phosphatase
MFSGKKFSAFLFDMDGTIINSIAATERSWGAWARRHGLDVAAFLPTIHGMRAIETIRRLALPGVDPDLEAETIAQAELTDVEGVVAIAGAAAFLAALPSTRWGVVTSAPRALALRRLAAAGLRVPPMLVTAEDVTNGKPAPEGFLLGASRLGVAAEDCLVFEDAPAGIQAGMAAGAQIVVVTAAHQHPVATRHLTISTYHELAVAADAQGLVLHTQKRAEAVSL